MSDAPDEPGEINRRWWNERARLHPGTALYQGALARLRRGESCLTPIERDEVGPLEGKRLLHLQCHLGHDTLSLALGGAEVTGVDFSADAIDAARKLAATLGIEARFLEADVLELDPAAVADHDIVFTSWGALCWLGDLDRWARLVAGALRPGGTFYIAEQHPFALTLHDRAATTEEALRLHYPYFQGPAPLEIEDPGSYAARDAKTIHNRTREWTHSLSRIFTVLLAHGLRIEFFHEHDGFPCATLPGMTQQADGLWRLPEASRSRVPLAFSLRAIKGTTGHANHRLG